MNEVKILNSSDKFAHASVGSLHDFEGKLFMKEALPLVKFLSVHCQKECRFLFSIVTGRMRSIT